MSHAVVRGSPTAAQYYVDSILRAAGTTTSLPAVLLHCLRSWPDDVMMIDATTAEHITNGQMLGRAVRVARALGGRSLGGRGALVLGVNSPALVTAQLGSLLAGVVPLGLDPVNSVFQLQYFLELWPPAVIFCDASCRDKMQQAVAALDYSPELVVLSDSQEWLDQFAEGYSDSLEGLPQVSPGDTALLLTTTGSTGPPKAALISHDALIAQLAVIWCHESTFPRPHQRAMIFSSAEWITWWLIMTSAIVSRVTFVTTSKPLTSAYAWKILDTYEVTWSLGPRILDPSSGSARSLRVMVCTGAAVPINTVEALQARLPQGGIVRQAYGMTELQSFFSIPDRDTPLGSVGKPLNLFKYKILDENDEECGPNQIGELYIKNNYIIKGYLKNESAHREQMTSDGWLRSGDRFRKDDAGNFYFVERSKFCFKAANLFHISPEQLEGLIRGVPGVKDVVVCGAPAGAAALVVRSDPSVTRQMVHHAVESRTPDYMHLHGGIAFVPSLPLTNNGKLHRRDCLALMEKLQEEKELFK